jgi:hypothetical protein
VFLREALGLRVLTMFVSGLARVARSAERAEIRLLVLPAVDQGQMVVNVAAFDIDG